MAEQDEFKVVNGKKMKKVKKDDGVWNWVEVALDVVATVAEGAADVVTDFDIDF